MFPYLHLLPVKLWKIKHKPKTECSNFMMRSEANVDNSNSTLGNYALIDL